MNAISLSDEKMKLIRQKIETVQAYFKENGLNKDTLNEQVGKLLHGGPQYMRTAAWLILFSGMLGAAGAPSLVGAFSIECPTRSGTECDHIRPCSA